MKRKKAIVFAIVIVPIILLSIILYLSQSHFDFSQDYISVEGYENIVFMDPKSKQCFRLCVWGLVRTEKPDGFEDHRDLVRSSEYQMLAENIGRI